MVKKERRLKKELRLIGLDIRTVSKNFGVSKGTVRNWIAGRTHIPPVTIAKLREMGIPRKALLNPSDLI